MFYLWHKHMDRLDKILMLIGKEAFPQQLIAPGFNQVDLHLGYRHRWFDLALDVENLLNGNYRSAQFATIGRLATEPAVGAAPPRTCGPNTNVITNASGGFAGCEDIHFTPAYPFTIRLTATAYVD